MQATQLRFHLPFTTTPKHNAQQQSQQLPPSVFDGIRNLRTLKTASGMCGSCR